jgi:hypothetical protein
MSVPNRISIPEQEFPFGMKHTLTSYSELTRDAERCRGICGLWGRGGGGKNGRGHFGLGSAFRDGVWNWLFEGWRPGEDTPVERSEGESKMV